MAEFIELNDPDINKFSSFLLDNTNKNEEETKEEISIETGNNDAKYDQIFTLDNGRAITQEDLNYYNNNPLVPAPKHIQDLREQLATNPNKVNVNSDPWLEDALQEDMKEMRSDVSELRATANRWKGAFWLMMGLGGAVGAVVNFAIGWLK